MRTSESGHWERIEKTFSELGKAGFVLFAHTLALARANLLFGTAAALKQTHPVKQGAS